MLIAVFLRPSQRGKLGGRVCLLRSRGFCWVVSPSGKFREGAHRPPVERLAPERLNRKLSDATINFAGVDSIHPGLVFLPGTRLLTFETENVSMVERNDISRNIHN